MEKKSKRETITKRYAFQANVRSDSVVKSSKKKKKSANLQLRLNDIIRFNSKRSKTRSRIKQFELKIMRR